MWSVKIEIANKIKFFSIYPIVTYKVECGWLSSTLLTVGLVFSKNKKQKIGLDHGYSEVELSIYNTEKGIDNLLVFRSHYANKRYAAFSRSTYIQKRRKLCLIIELKLTLSILSTSCIR